MSEDPKKETGFLSTSNSSAGKPMQDRKARPNTTILGPNSRLQVRIGDNKIVVDIADSMLIGRVIDDTEAKDYALDLGPHGGYQGGVSRRHASITRHEGGLYIEDLGSTNGTRINGFQLTARRKYRLRDGDEIEFARLRTIFRFIPGD